MNRSLGRHDESKLHRPFKQIRGKCFANTTHQWYFTGQEVKLNNAERI